MPPPAAIRPENLAKLHFKYTHPDLGIIYKTKFIGNINLNQSVWTLIITSKASLPAISRTANFLPQLASRDIQYPAGIRIISYSGLHLELLTKI